MFRLISRLIFKMNGWTMDAKLVEGIPKTLFVGAPHTSNWDAVYFAAAMSLMKVNVRFLIKKEWMRFPFNMVFGPLGGIALDRTPKKPDSTRPSMVEVMTEMFKASKELVIAIAPEGTRSPMTRWKRGFYRTAVAAEIPIALGYLDYEKKVAGFGKVLHPKGDMDKDMRVIMEFYSHIHPRNPENFVLDQQYAPSG